MIKRLFYAFIAVVLLMTMCGCSDGLSRVKVGFEDSIKNFVVTEDKPEETAEALDFSTNPPKADFGEVNLDYLAENVSYSIYYFGDGYTVSKNSSHRSVSASVIKVFIMEYAFNEITNGNIGENDLINGNTVINLVTSMIQYSDNNATNVLIDYFGMDKLNKFFAGQGYTNTVLERKMLDFNAQSQGFENYTSADDTTEFLTKVYNNCEEYPYSKMLEIMLGQTVRTKIPVMLPNDVLVANKTGELSNVENDIALVFTDKGDFAISVFTCNFNSGGNVRNAISELAKQAYEYLNK